ncbi:hypothetical protein [Nitrospira sp. Kam-Ns4a]
MRAHRLLVMGCVGLLAFGGCGSPGVITLELKPTEAGGAGAKGTSLAVVVTAFEDARPDKGRLGVRHHFWGSETAFDVPAGKAGDAVAGVVAAYLKGKGWHAQVAPDGATGDVALSGKLLALSVEATSRFLRTEIKVTSKVVVEAKNAADGSLVRMTLHGDGSETVFWFEPEDVQDLLNTVLTESLGKFLANTKVENGLLRLK